METARLRTPHSTVKRSSARGRGIIHQAAGCGRGCLPFHGSPTTPHHTTLHHTHHTTPEEHARCTS